MSLSAKAAGHTLYLW